MYLMGLCSRVETARGFMRQEGECVLAGTYLSICCPFRMFDDGFSTGCRGFFHVTVLLRLNPERSHKARGEEMKNEGLENENKDEKSRKK